MEQNVLNISVNECDSNQIPSIYHYYEALHGNVLLLICTSSIVLIIVTIVFLSTLRNIIKQNKIKTKAYSIFVTSVYPVVSLAAYCTLIIPRAYLISEAIIQEMVMVTMYKLFCLFIAYANGESELIRKSKNQLILRTKVGPCCCWPCCYFLPTIPVDKKILQKLHLLILQLPIVQGLIYMILLILWAEEETIYRINYKYFQPLIVTSILFGIWGMIMTIRMLRNIIDEHNILSKFIILQCVLIFSKIQGFITRILVSNNVSPCNMPLSSMLYANGIHNSLLMIEMLILSLIAYALYTKNSKTIKVCSISYISNEKINRSATPVCLMYQSNNVYI